MYLVTFQPLLNSDTQHRVYYCQIKNAGVKHTLQIEVVNGGAAAAVVCHCSSAGCCKLLSGDACKLPQGDLIRRTVHLAGVEEVLLSAPPPSSSSTGDCAAISVPAASSAADSTHRVTLNAFVVSLQKKKKNISVFTSEPITSVILDVIPPSPPWQACAISIPIVGWKSGQFRISYLASLSLNSLLFSPSLGVGRTSSPSSLIPAQSIHSLLRFLPPPPPPTGQSHCSKLRGADGKYFLQPRSQSILHQLKCCWEEAGRFFVVVVVVVVVWAFALMIRSWCGFCRF